MMTTLVLLGLAAGQASGGLTYPDLQAKCSDLIANSRMKPPRIRLACHSTRLVWDALDSSPLQPSTATDSVQIGGSATMKGYTVEDESTTTSVSKTLEQCRLAQWSEQVTLATDSSCDEVLAGPATIEELCDGVIAKAVAAHPELVKRTTTGEVVDQCAP